jgi:hypothetical protein
MEDSLAERALLDAITTARVPTDHPCPTRHLAIAPPYDWSRTYMAAKDMEEYLPGVPLDATLVEATEDGFDVLASDGVTSLVHVVVERRRHQPLRPGDPVVATVAGVGLEGDLLREGRPGEWVVRVKVGGDQQPVEEMKVPASDVAFSWRVGRDMWMKAVRLAPLRLAARKADWLGIGSLELDIFGSPKALSAGDPAALFGLQDEPELNGQVRGLKSSLISAFMDASIQCALTASVPLSVLLSHTGCHPPREAGIFRWAVARPPRAARRRRSANNRARGVCCGRRRAAQLAVSRRVGRVPARIRLGTRGAARRCHD